MTVRKISSPKALFWFWTIWRFTADISHLEAPDCLLRFFTPYCTGVKSVVRGKEA